MPELSRFYGIVIKMYLVIMSLLTFTPNMENNAR